MKDVTIFIKDIGYETGVVVSVRHLTAILQQHNVDFEVYSYKDDEDLLRGVTSCNSRCLNLQVPSFSDETMEKIRETSKNIVLSIHSTMCNLQVEGDALTRIVNWSKKHSGNFRITCPSESETAGFNAFSNIEFLYLPNTFSYEVNPTDIEKKISQKCAEMNPIKISLFCAYRPFKNMITQVAAVAMLARKYPVELHMFNERREHPLFKNIVNMAEQSAIKLVLHGSLSNRECFQLMGEMHLGLQVSLSETFSYVAFEHMVQGVPVIGSHSIPFASLVAKYSDVTDMARCMEEIILGYKEFALKSMQTANKVRTKNNTDALTTIRQGIGDRSLFPNSLNYPSNQGTSCK